MDPSFDRRRFLRSAMALGGGFLAGTYRPAAHAAPSGRALVGFQLAGSATTLIEGVLSGLRDLYQPDLIAKPVAIPGASGALAVDALLKAPADGSTVALLPSSLLTLLPLTRSLPDEPTSRMQPVAGVGEFCFTFVVGPAVPKSVQTMADYAAWVRQNPMFTSYGVPGLGTAPHFVGRELGRIMGIPLKAVAYRGLPAVAADVQSGTLAAGIVVTHEASFFAMYPGLRMLGVTSDQRWPGFPDVPTMIETKAMEAPALESLGVFFATGTPQSKIDELAAAIRKTTASPAMLNLMASINMRTMPTTTASYAAVLAQERSGWLHLVKRVEGTGPA